VRNAKACAAKPYRQGIIGRTHVWFLSKVPPYGLAAIISAIQTKCLLSALARVLELGSLLRSGVLYVLREGTWILNEMVKALAKVGSRFIQAIEARDLIEININGLSSHKAIPNYYYELLYIL
jgi:hypothetical protein